MKRHAQIATATVSLLFAATGNPLSRADLFDLTDINPDPNIFECDITAVQKDVTLGSDTVHAMAYKDENASVPPASAGIPIKIIRVKVGDFILCRFKNQLAADSASIHWHGIELDNDSDGTPVTQDAVLPGQSYTYRFQTFRPGIFWFHSHMLPGNTLLSGIYGVLIVENPIESTLIGNNTLPDANSTYTLAMSDIEYDGSGNVGKIYNGTFYTENELIEMCHLFGTGDGTENTCNLSTLPGTKVLVNGQKPDATAHTPVFTVPSGKKIRLRLLNESISRHFRLKLLPQLVGGANYNGDKNLYRIGGQGGLLDRVIVEGVNKGTLTTPTSDPGEILIGSGMRADVIIYPTGSDGDIIQLAGTKTSGTFQISNGLPTDYPIAYFQISGTGTDTAPAAGDPILAGTAEEIESIKSAATVGLVSPAPDGGSDNETIRLTTDPPTGPPAAFVNKQPGVDQYAAVLDSNAGNGDWLLVPKTPVSRYAHIGDVLELTVRNDTDSDHPYHLHGFSMQPVRLIDNNDATKFYDFDYNEFLDTIDVYGHHSYIFRVRIDDRAKFCDSAPNVPPDDGPVLAACSAGCGGAVGRWLFHCHIASHGSLGMIGELTILPGGVVDDPPTIICPADITVNNDPGKCSAVVNFAASATDDCGFVTIDYSPTPGSAFAVGTTLVTCTATDSASQTAQCTFNVTVKDAEAPKITSSVAISQLSSVSHDLVNVGLSATATDNCGGSVTLGVSVYGDEDDELSTGDGTHSPDAKNIAVGTLRLRAERNQKGDGRVYLIIITATDSAGNKSTACHTVVVPKDATAKSLASVQQQATTARNYCTAIGAPPPGYVVIGDGPVIGPKQ